MAKSDSDVNLNDLNDSELVLLCSWLGIRASRAWPRDLLIYSLENFEPVDIPQPFDEERTKMSGFLKMHWDRFRLQVDKKVCPNCFECREMQIMSCFNKNRRRIGGGAP